MLSGREASVYSQVRVCARLSDARHQWKMLIPKKQRHLASYEGLGA